MSTEKSAEARATRCSKCNGIGRHVRVRHFDIEDADVWECQSPLCVNFGLLWHTSREKDEAGKRRIAELKAMKTDTPTPRTDERARSADRFGDDDVVRADFARTLERELTAATKDRDRFKGHFKATAKQALHDNKAAAQLIASHALKRQMAERERDQWREVAEGLAFWFGPRHEALAAFEKLKSTTL